MTDKEKKSKIADILMDFQEEYSNEVVNRPMLASLYAGNILSFIDSLQEKPVSEELEKAAKDYSNNLDNIRGSMGEQTRNAFKAGAKWQKEQMLKKSFGATVCKYLNTFLKEMDKDAISQALREYTNGDRVRVLIIKQE